MIVIIGKKHRSPYLLMSSHTKIRVFVDTFSLQYKICGICKQTYVYNLINTEIICKKLLFHVNYSGFGFYLYIY